MNKHKFILPVIFLLCIFSAGWYAYSPSSQIFGATALNRSKRKGIASQSGIRYPFQFDGQR